MADVGLLSRMKKRKSAASDDRRADDAVTLYLSEFVATHRGVEAYVEQATQMNPPTVLLVAFDGAWTRRRVPSDAWGHKFAEHHSIPSYDAAVVGYPQRMRDYNARQKRRK